MKLNNPFDSFKDKNLKSQSILDIFVLQNVIDFEDAANMKRYLRTNREIEDFLVKNHLVTADNINKAYSILLKMPFVSLSNIRIPEEAKKIIAREVAKKYGVIPFYFEDRILRLAVSRPSDLIVGYGEKLGKIFENKNILIELYITGRTDFAEALHQYDTKPKDKLLLSKGSLPVIYLRNISFEQKYLEKVPKKYIEKYRLAVFSQNAFGEYMLACEEPDSTVTKKVIEYMEQENKVSFERFATSRDDIDYVLGIYDSVFAEKEENVKDNASQKIEKVIELNKEPVFQSEDIRVKGIDKDSGFFSKLFSNNEPVLTIDSVVDDKSEAYKKITLRQTDIDKTYLSELPIEFVKKYRVAVFGESSDGRLKIAVDNIDSVETTKAIEFIKGQQQIELFLVSPEGIDLILSNY